MPSRPARKTPQSGGAARSRIDNLGIRERERVECCGRHGCPAWFPHGPRWRHGVQGTQPLPGSTQDRQRSPRRRVVSRRREGGRGTQTMCSAGGGGGVDMCVRARDSETPVSYSVHRVWQPITETVQAPSVSDMLLCDSQERKSRPSCMATYHRNSPSTHCICASHCVALKQACPSWPVVRLTYSTCVGTVF